MKRILSATLAVIVVLTLFVYSRIFTSLPKEMPDDFSFSITWGVAGSSYDSKTGKLLKTKDATNPEDYITTYILSNEELETVYRLIRKLNIEKYKYEIEWREFGHSDPSMSLSLTIHANGVDKTIKADGVPDYSSGRTARARKYLETIKAVRDILVETDEWKALPDYEHYYL